MSRQPIRQAVGGLVPAGVSVCREPGSRSMVVCNFFLQGRCRYGDRCWNEHPGRGGGGGGRQYQQPPQGNARGGWNSQPDRYTSNVQSYNDYKWASSGSNRDAGKAGLTSGSGTQDSRNKSSTNKSASGFSFSQNKFSALSSTQDVSDSQRDEDADLIDVVRKDIESWESSGQWMFSVYSAAKEKPNLSGFEDFSPEELRLECYSCRAEGNLQNYITAVQQLVNKWMNRLNELKNSNSSIKAALISELKKSVGETKPAFGIGQQQAPTFGSASLFTNNVSSSSASSFSFKPQSDVASTAGGSTAAFGSSSIIQGLGFGTPAASGFGTPGFSGFGGSSNTVAASGFGTVNSATAATTVFGSVATTIGGSLLGQSQSVSGFGSNTPTVPSIPGSLADVLFTPLTDLSSEELNQFQAKKFTLGMIPLKPPPTELLMV